ncbi:hypothetical protein ATKI12_6959 [Kitasatospora sp. Ki12]
MVTFAEYLERHARDDRTALKCARCYRRRPRLDFREMPWHGRAAACKFCEGSDRYLAFTARQAWQLGQEREKIRALRRRLTEARRDRERFRGEMAYARGRVDVANEAWRVVVAKRDRLQAFADEVRQLRDWSFTGEPDQYRDRLRRVWEALHELEKSMRV